MLGFLRVHQFSFNKYELICFVLRKAEGHIVMKDDSIVPVSNRKKGAAVRIVKYDL
jgi:hypothetical protein